MLITKISDGRTCLYQWDTGVKIELCVCDEVTEMHFVTPDGTIRRDVENNVVSVPDVALQTAGTLTMYAFLRDASLGITRHEVCIKVIERPKPADYIDPPDESAFIDQVCDRLKVLPECKGEQGPKGPKGDTGEQGPQGEPGKDAVVDATLSQSGQAADAKVTGEALAGKLDNTPGTWPEWTVDEQAARERIGIGNYELLEESVFEETITYMSRKTDKDGNEYCLNAIIIYLVTEPDESNGTGRCVVYSDDGYVCDYYLEKLNNTQGSISTVKAYSLNGCWDSVARNAINNLQSTTRYANIMNGYIKPIVKTGYIRSFYVAGKITAGSKLIVYGVRA